MQEHVVYSSWFSGRYKSSFNFCGGGNRYFPLVEIIMNLEQFDVLFDKKLSIIRLYLFCFVDLFVFCWRGKITNTSSSSLRSFHIIRKKKIQKIEASICKIEYKNLRGYKWYSKAEIPWFKGFSVTSVKRFCKENRISPRVSKEYLREIVSKAVDQVTLFRLLILLSPCIYMYLEDRHTPLQVELDRKLFMLLVRSCDYLPKQ